MTIVRLEDGYDMIQRAYACCLYDINGVTREGPQA